MGETILGYSELSRGEGFCIAEMPLSQLRREPQHAGCCVCSQGAVCWHAADSSSRWWRTVITIMQVMSVVGILQDETDPMVSVMKVRAGVL